MKDEQVKESIRQLLVITGMSGAGKTTALKIFEDMGFFAMDNVPSQLLPQSLNLLQGYDAARCVGVAATLDARNVVLSDDFVDIIKKLRSAVDNVRVIFLDASDDILVRRYAQTRRSHPLSTDVPIHKAILRERHSLRALVACADVVIDTSTFDTYQYRQHLNDRLFSGTFANGRIFFTSFGFKHGVPADCNYLFDVRFLPNPFYVPDLKPFTGQDSCIQDYLLQFVDTRNFLEESYRFLDYLIPQYVNAGKPHLHIAIGCTGGCHRSVALAEWLHNRYSQTYSSCIYHRDVKRS